MKKLCHSLLLLIAGATQKELAAQVRYLKSELEIAQSKLPKRQGVTAQERSRPVRCGPKMGKALEKPHNAVAGKGSLL